MNFVIKKKFVSIMLMVSAGVYFVYSLGSYYVVPRHNTLHIKIVEIFTSVESDSTGIQGSSLAVWVYLPPSTGSHLLYIFERHYRIYPQMFGNIKYYNHSSMQTITTATCRLVLLRHRVEGSQCSLSYLSFVRSAAPGFLFLL